MIRTLILLLFAGVSGTCLFAQKGNSIQIKWNDDLAPVEINGNSLYAPECLSCASIDPENSSPVFLGKIPLGKGVTASAVSVEIVASHRLNTTRKNLVSTLPGSVNETFTYAISEERGVNVLLYRFGAALDAGNNAATLIDEFRLNIKQNRISTHPKSANFASSSVLAQGEWYKIGVPENGIYKLTQDDLKNLGIDVNILNPQTLNIYGNGFGQMPFENSVPRPDDLKINSIELVGGADESFDKEDYILFYAKGPNTWSVDTTTNLFERFKNQFTDTSYYFIGINTGDAPARITTLSSSGSSPNYEVSSFNAYQAHEMDRENMLKSGREWYGEKFDVQTTYNFSGEEYTFPNLDPNAETVVEANLLSRSTVTGSSCKFLLDVNGVQDFEGFTSTGTSATSLFGYAKTLRVTLTNASPGLNINITYTKNAPSASGWLNWININTRRKLRMTGSQMEFRDLNSVGDFRISRFNLTNIGSETRIWEVTDPTNAMDVNFSRTGAQASFTLPTGQLREFIAFSGGYKTPTLFGSVENQNLHALGLSDRIDMVIVTPSKLALKADELADIHRQYEPDPLNVEVVKLQDIYNEFSSGMRDVTAIKWFMKMLYDRANGNELMMPRYLLLFGDGSYDNKNFTPGNTNLIPTFQSENSLSPAYSYVSDDYFGFLSDDEGEDKNDLMDVAVGRIVAKNIQEASSVINKVRKYVEIEPQIFTDDCSVCGDNTSNFGAWRNKIALVADYDGNSFMSDSRTLTNLIQDYTRDYNIEQIFLDSYPVVATPGGNRYPSANKAIEQAVETGAFIVNYIGHGGELGWSASRILNVPTIQHWSNGTKLPIFMTATCEFSRFDDPLRTSAGEYVLLNGNGGGIALLTTTRLVYSGPNFTLNKKFYEALFNRPEGEIVTRIGDLSRESKNATAISAGTANHRNFSLLGDPALPIAIPKYKAEISAITDTLGNPVDTLKALGVVRVNGRVVGSSGQTLTSFKGRLNPTVYDRVETKTTLGSNPFSYPAQENIVYRGNAEIINGKFQFDFVIPKDISYAVDSTARISLYATGETSDATGYRDSLTIGGRDPNAVDDGRGPDVKVYLNDENFVYGGYTNDEPILLASVYDQNGVNTVGSGIGHDITAVLDGDENNAIILNDFYESDLNTYKSGKVQYQFDKLEPGKHKLKLKVWDVNNNSNESEVEFVVSDNEDFSIKRVLNYPNPFTTHTEFYFEHNQSCSFLNVLIQIYTVSGKLVKTINTVSNTDGFRNEPIAWDGRDEYGDRLATGVYVYKLAVRNPAGEQVDKFEKLVILN